jgi:hypothetical protein
MGLQYKGVHYNIGPTPDDVVVNLYNEQEYETTPLWNVIGVINGTIPDEVIGECLGFAIRESDSGALVRPASSELLRAYVVPYGDANHGATQLSVATAMPGSPAELGTLTAGQPC